MSFLREFLKGVLIGVANIIPGVSGGTMAVSMGVYDKIIKAINNLRKQFAKSVLTLLPYALGAVAGIGALSFMVKSALETYPLQTSGLFIGLIAGGLPVLFKKVKGARPTPGNIIAFLVFFAIVAGMAFMSGGDGAATDITLSVGTVLLLCLMGAVASATMIIPGVSGSLVLMILGFYGIVISNISGLISALSPLDSAALLHGLGVLVPFGLGILLGIGLIAKLIDMLFAKAPVITYFAILGLVFGSPVAILYKVGAAGVTVLSAAATVLLFALGFAVSFFLGGEGKPKADAAP